MLGPVPLRPEFLPAVQMFETKYPNTNAQPIPLLDHLLSGLESKPQRWLTALVDVSLQKAWYATLGPRHRRLAEVLEFPFSGGWLSALPIPALGYRVPPRFFRSMIYWRLGLPLYPRGTLSPPKCPMHDRGTLHVLDPLGDHAASCIGSIGQTARHNLIRNALKSECEKAGFLASIEGGGIIDATPGRRPADVLIHDYDGASSLCIDVSIIHTLAKSYLASPTKSLLEAVETRKIKDYRSGVEGSS